MKCSQQLVRSKHDAANFTINGSPNAKHSTRNAGRSTDGSDSKKKKQDGEEEGRMCDKCRDQLNTDAMSQSAVSISTAYGSQMFSKSTVNFKGKGTGDANGGEPKRS